MNQLSPERIAAHVAFVQDVKTRNISWNEADKVVGIALEALDALTTAQKALDNIKGDNLCWIQSDDDLAKAKVLPESEFLESCKRYHAQIIAERGTLVGAKTIAQLEIEFWKESQVSAALARCARRLDEDKTALKLQLITIQKELAEAQALADKRYQEGMVGHRAFAKLFGEVMDGKDFDVKLSIAEGIIDDLRARAERAEATNARLVRWKALWKNKATVLQSALTAAREETGRFKKAWSKLAQFCLQYQEREQKLREKVEAEKVDAAGTGEESDFAYNRAIDDVLSLIDSLGKDEPVAKDCLTTELS